MKYKLIIMIFSFFSLLILSGCSRVISLGYEHPYCEENGLNYQDAGVCGDPMLIYKYRYYINENDVAYKKGCTKCQ